MRKPQAPVDVHVSMLKLPPTKLKCLTQGNVYIYIYMYVCGYVCMYSCMYVLKFLKIKLKWIDSGT